MEIERIQQVRGLKVERTGSESERRRHQQSEQDFNELLEHSLKDHNGNGQPDQQSKDQEHPKPVSAPAQPVVALLPRDTVSISTGAQLNPAAVPDQVSISASARVGAESMNAAAHALRISLVQRTALGLRNIIGTVHAGPARQQDEHETAAAEKAEPPATVDTVV